MKTFENRRLNGLKASARWIALPVLAVGLQTLVVLPLHASTSTKSITDPGITAAVESDLRLAKSSTPELLGVSTSQGIVKLSGHSDNLLAKDRAVKVAESIRGVRSVTDRIEIAPVSRPDADIRKDVLTPLQQDPATESYQVEVSVQDARATLTGSVGSWTESRLAERIAKGVKGLKGVTNDLIVNYLAKRTDAEMTGDVNARLQWHVWLARNPLRVKVTDAKVALTGTVGSVLEKTRAWDDSWVNGLAMVGNKKWEQGMANFCAPFTHADVRFFDPTQFAEARDWLGIPPVL